MWFNGAFVWCSSIWLVIGPSFSSAADVSHSSPTVGAPVGKIRGFKQTVHGGNHVYAFTGIPFAQTPIGDLRYRKPVPATPWGDKVLNATETPPSCMQLPVFWPRRLHWVAYDQDLSEDCLYLSVWTPTLSSKASLPVIAWIHGGQYRVGSAAMPLEDGGNLASLGDVIVVNIAYRLTSFGFLYDGTDAAPGNQGLHDQILGLKWIRENIAAFGGNPDEVTLLGWSAGGISAGFHLPINNASNLFNRIISQSGGITTAGRAQDKNKLLQYSRQFAQTFGCYNGSLDNSSCESFAGCLQSINASLLTVIDAEFHEQGHGFFDPIYGDELLPVEPKQAEFPGDKDVVLGQVANEGTNFVYLSFRDTFSKILTPRKVNKLEMIYFIRNMYGALTLPQAMQLQRAYMEAIAEDNYGALRQALIEIRGHTEVTCGSLDVAYKLANSTTQKGEGKGVYFYEMNYVSSCSKEHPWVGMTHGDDFPFVFGRPFDKNGCAKDRPFSWKLIKMWSDFAKGRAPSGPGGEEWPKFTEESKLFLRITGKKTSVSVFDDGLWCPLLRDLELC